MLNIIIPLAGEGSRFKDAGFTDPKPFIKVADNPMISEVVQNLNAGARDHRFIFCVRKEHVGELKELFFVKYMKNTEIIVVDENTEGTVCTLLLAKHLINNNDELVIANSDQIIDFDFEDFLDQGAKGDGCIAVFEDTDPKWSFAKVENNRVVEVAEKNPISNLATCGVYYWRRGRDFVDAAECMIEANDRVNGEFYACPSYNYFVQDHDVSVYHVSAMHGLGTPVDLVNYLNYLLEI
jgi:NDP-sugar pyrophosphorylase family protein